MITSSQTGLKRKHRTVFNSDGKEDDDQPPLPKRQQIISNCNSENKVGITSEYSLIVDRTPVEIATKNNIASYIDLHSQNIYLKNKNQKRENSDHFEQGHDKDMSTKELCNSEIIYTHKNISVCHTSNEESKSLSTLSPLNLKSSNFNSNNLNNKINIGDTCILSEDCSYEILSNGIDGKESDIDNEPRNNSDSGDNYLQSFSHMNYICCMTPRHEAEFSRQCPLPALAWANAHDVWQLMCKKDEDASYLRNANMLDRHPGLQPRMRAILLDWLIEVCEVYKLHRETYYLAVDYLDRYLSVQEKVQKTHLQLIGITCLFIAAKVEEIYPPKIGEFAYVTDGACQEIDILQHEILLLQTLDWNISPVTPMGWLGVYMQLSVNNRSVNVFPKIPNTKTTIHNYSVNIEKELRLVQRDDVDETFIYPQFSGWQFSQTAKLLDLCSLDLGFADYSYSVIAATAMYYTFNKDTALGCSGLNWHTIEPCAKWMEPFFRVISEEANYMHTTEQNDQLNSKFGLGVICPDVVTDDSHIIQTHAITMNLFERAEQYYLLSINKMNHETSPGNGLKYPEGLLTPPASSRKSIDKGEYVRQNVVQIRIFPMPATSLKFTFPH